MFRKVLINFKFVFLCRFSIILIRYLSSYLNNCPHGNTTHNNTPHTRACAGQEDKDNLFVCLNQRNRLGYKTKCLLEMWVVQRWRPKIRVVYIFRKGTDLFTKLFGYVVGTERVQNKECGCSAKQAFYQCG